MLISSENGRVNGNYLLFPCIYWREKNIMDTCALYRKVEWERAGGYCESIIAREDWEFWIAVLKDGGKVVRLPEIGLHYRIRNVSKRVTDRC